MIGTESAQIQAGNTINFSLAVEWTFSGTLQAGNVIFVTSDPQLPRPVRLDNSTGLRGIWFLKQGDGGNWECIPAAHSGNGTIFFREFPYPVGAGPLPTELAYDDGTTTLSDKLLLEMAAGTANNPGLIINAASGLSSTAVLTAFRYYATRPADASLIGLAGLVEMGDPNALLQAAGLASSLNSSTGASGRLISAVSLFRGTDPSAAASMGQMAVSIANSPQLRLAAARSLLAIHTAAAVPYLRALLSDQSLQLQVVAAQGLSFFVNGVGVPTAQTMPTLSHLNQRQATAYQTIETQQNLGYPAGGEILFVQYWSAWWNQHQELHTQNVSVR